MASDVREWKVRAGVAGRRGYGKCEEYYTNNVNAGKAGAGRRCGVVWDGLELGPWMMLGGGGGRLRWEVWVESPGAHSVGPPSLVLEFGLGATSV